VRVHGGVDADPLLGELYYLELILGFSFGRNLQMRPETGCFKF
jgi:hypothetical protein